MMSYFHRRRDSETLPPRAVPELSAVPRQNRYMVPVCVTISPDSLEWVDNEVIVGTYRNRSHGIEECVRKVRESSRRGSRR